MSMEPNEENGYMDADEAYFAMLRARGVDEPCDKCDGLGRFNYPNTGTWRASKGMVVGRAFTMDVCDACWGSGDAKRHGVDLRELEAEVRLAGGLAETLSRKRSPLRIVDVPKVGSALLEALLHVGGYNHAESAGCLASAAKQAIEGLLADEENQSVDQELGSAVRDLEGVDELIRALPVLRGTRR